MREQHDPKFVQQQGTTNGSGASTSASTPLQEVTAAPGSVSSTASRFGGTAGGGKTEEVDKRTKRNLISKHI